MQNVHCNISNSKSCWFSPLQELQIISLTSPLLDILDLHPITTHLSKLPIFRDAATKWHHSSRIPAFPNISRRDIFSRLDVCCTNISPETCSPCPEFIRWWKEGQMCESWKFNFVLRHNFPTLPPTLSSLSLFTFETRSSL